MCNVCPFVDIRVDILSLDQGHEIAHWKGLLVIKEQMCGFQVEIGHYAIQIL